MSARGFVKASLGAVVLGGAAAALATAVTSRRCARSGRADGVLLATRIHLPEAAAASFRLDSVEKALVADGMAVRVLTSRAPADAPQGEPDPEGVEVSRWPVLRDSSGYLRGYVPYLSFDLPLALRLLMAPQPEAILVEPPPTTGAVVRVVAALRAIPYVWYAADVWSAAAASTGAADIVVRAVEKLEAFAVGGATRVIAVNDGVAQSVAELVNAAPDDESWAQRIRVVPNGIDTAVFDAHGPTPSEQDRARIGLSGPYFVYAGTASEWQGADVFVHALAQVRRTHPKAQLLFLGRGTAWQEITQAASQLPAGADGAPAVIMHPAVPAAEAAVWQRGAAAALVSIKPGQGYDFAYPTKVLSALGCGTPVLFAGDGPVSADLRDFDLGWAAEHDAAAVAEAMRTALDVYDAETASGARPATAQRFHDWVEDHRSLRATGQSAARIVQEVIAGADDASKKVDEFSDVRRVSEEQRW